MLHAKAMSFLKAVYVTPMLRALLQGQALALQA
jgi:hypothetical protein